MEVLIIFAFFCLSVQNIILLRAVERPRREFERDQAIEDAMNAESAPTASDYETEQRQKAFEEGIDNILGYQVGKKDGE